MTLVLAHWRGFLARFSIIGRAKYHFGGSACKRYIQRRKPLWSALMLDPLAKNVSQERRLCCDCNARRLHAQIAQFFAWLIASGLSDR